MGAGRERAAWVALGACVVYVAFSVLQGQRATQLAAQPRVPPWRGQLALPDAGLAVAGTPVELTLPAGEHASVFVQLEGPAGGDGAVRPSVRDARSDAWADRPLIVAPCHVPLWVRIDGQGPLRGVRLASQTGTVTVRSAVALPVSAAAPAALQLKPFEDGWIATDPRTGATAALSDGIVSLPGTTIMGPYRSFGRRAFEMRGARGLEPRERMTWCDEVALPVLLATWRPPAFALCRYDRAMARGLALRSDGRVQVSGIPPWTPHYSSRDGLLDGVPALERTLAEAANPMTGVQITPPAMAGAPTRMVVVGAGTLWKQLYVNGGKGPEPHVRDAWVRFIKDVLPAFRASGIAPPKPEHPRLAAPAPRDPKRAPSADVAALLAQLRQAPPPSPRPPDEVDLLVAKMRREQSQAMAAAQQARIPTTAPAPVASAPPLLPVREAMLPDPPEDPVPWPMLLAYRATLLDGLTWLKGARAVARDGDDRFWSAVCDVAGTELHLVFRADAGGVRVTASARGTSKELRRFPAAERTTPEQAAQRALGDVDALAALLALPARAPRATSAAALSAWSPGELVDVAPALAALDVDGPADVNLARGLARAARALSWQAFLDNRLAPALVPERAAQAIALAAVAERAAGAALPEADAARWLSAGASRDLWMLARRPPPAGFPELVPLHRSYREPTIPFGKPDAFDLPACLELVERDVLLEGTVSLRPIAGWVTGVPVAATYAVMAGAHVHHEVKTAPAALPLKDLIAVASVRAVLPASAAAEVNALSPDIDGADTPRVLALVRTCAALARTAPARSTRVMLEEAAERALRGVAARLADVRAHQNSYAVTDVSKALFAHVDWLHPELQLQLLRECHFRVQIAPATARRARAVVADAARRMPLVGRPVFNVDARDGIFAEEAMFLAALDEVRSTGDSPGAHWRLAESARVAGHDAIALVLAERLARREGIDRVPFFCAMAADPPAELALRECLERASPGWARCEPIAYRLFDLYTRAFRDAEAVAMWDGFQPRRSLPARLVSKRVSHQLMMGRADLANALLDRTLREDPEAARYAAGVAHGFRLAGDARAGLRWAREHAQLRMAGPIVELAYQEAEDGRHADARRLVAPLATNLEKPDLERAQALLTLAESRGKRGWDELEPTLDGVDADTMSTAALVLHVLKLQAPARSGRSPLARLAPRAAAHLAQCRLRAGAAGVADVESIHAAIDRAAAPQRSELFAELRHHIDFVLARVYLTALRSGRPDALAQARRAAQRGGPVTYDRAAHLTALAMRSRASPEEVARLVADVVPLLAPADRALFEAATSPPGSVRELSLYGGLAAPVAVQQVAIHYWLTGRDAAALRVLAALLAYPEPAARTQVPALAALICETPQQAAEWLKRHGVANAALPDLRLERAALRALR